MPTFNNVREYMSLSAKKRDCVVVMVVGIVAVLACTIQSDFDAKDAELAQAQSHVRQKRRDAGVERRMRALGRRATRGRRNSSAAWAVPPRAPRLDHARLAQLRKDERAEELQVVLRCQATHLVRVELAARHSVGAADAADFATDAVVVGVVDAQEGVLGRLLPQLVERLPKPDTVHACGGGKRGEVLGAAQLR
jgi:hypothetical protein